MSTARNDMLLLQRLRGSREFAALGFVAELMEPSGVVLIRANHAHGLWRFQDDAFYYTRPAYREPCRRAETAEAALMATLQLLQSANRAVADFVKSRRFVRAARAD